MESTTSQPQEEVTEGLAHRIEWLEELGFTLAEATKLATAKDHQGWPVAITRIQKVLRQCNSHRMTVRLFT